MLIQLLLDISLYADLKLEKPFRLIPILANFIYLPHITTPAPLGYMNFTILVYPSFCDILQADYH